MALRPKKAASCALKLRCMVSERVREVALRDRVVSGSSKNLLCNRRCGRLFRASAVRVVLSTFLGWFRWATTERQASAKVMSAIYTSIFVNIIIVTK